MHRTACLICFLALQDTLMDLPLRTISYIADIGNMVVLMARGKMVRSRSAQENLDNTGEQTTMSHDDRRLYRMICHVFESEDVSLKQSLMLNLLCFVISAGDKPKNLETFINRHGILAILACCKHSVLSFLWEQTLTKTLSLLIHDVLLSHKRVFTTHL